MTAGGCVGLPAIVFGRRPSIMQAVKVPASPRISKTKQDLKPSASSLSSKPVCNRFAKHLASSAANAKNHAKIQKEAKTQKSSSPRKWTGSFILMVELRKQILIFRDIIDLRPLDGSRSITETMILTLEDLRKLCPEIIQSRKFSEMKRGNTNTMLVHFHDTLKSIGDSWISDPEWMDKCKYKNKSSSVGKNPRYKLVENVLATLDALIKMTKQRFETMEHDEEEEERKREAKRRKMAKTYSGRSMLSPSGSYSESSRSFCGSPATPKSVLPEFMIGLPEKIADFESSSSPGLRNLRAQALDKLSPIDVKRLAVHLLCQKGSQDEEDGGEKSERLPLEQETCFPVTPMPSSSPSASKTPSVAVEPSSPPPLTNTETALGTNVGNPPPPPPSIVPQTHVVAPSTPPPSGPMSGPALLSPPQPQSLTATVAPPTPQTVASIGLVAPPPPLPPPKTMTLSSSLPSFLGAASPPTGAPPPPPPLPRAMAVCPPPAASPLGSAAASLPPLPPRAPNASPPPPPPLPGAAASPASPPPPLGSSVGVPPPPPIPRASGAAGPPPPPMPLAKGAAAPPPPPGSTRNLLQPRKTNTKLKRSTHIGNLYRSLKGKVEGRGPEERSTGGRKGAVGNGRPSGKQGMADALAEMTKRSAYFQQIEEDVQKYAKAINELKLEISKFETKDTEELLRFHKKVESVLENLTDETQVLARFEGFPEKKLEALRTATALYLKLQTIVTELRNWKIEPPVNQLLDKLEAYFTKIKSEVDRVDRTKEEEGKKLESHKIHFDFNIVMQIKESMVDVSSGCMELALKEKRDAKKEGSDVKNTQKRSACAKTLWKAFQFAFKVYTFAGGHDDRADNLTTELAQEIQTEPQYQ